MTSSNVLHAIRALIVVTTPAMLQGQSTSFHCKPPADKSESKQLAYFASPLTFSAAPEVMGLAPGQISIAGDLTLVPTVPSSISKSTGFCGFAKSENSNLSPVFPRPRVAVGLGNGVVAELSYLPPVTVLDATPNMFGVALSWSPANLALPAALQLHLRAHGTFGGVKGPITCPRSALQPTNPTSDCYANTPSSDTYSPNVRGVEAIVSRPAGALQWYAGAGVNQVQSFLQVDLTKVNGFHDGNTVEINLTRIALLGGAVWTVRPTVALSAQLYSIPDDATTARVGIAWRAR